VNAMVAATAVALAMAGATSASAATYVVGSSGDDTAAPCLPAVPTCTLRSAMEATAASSEADSITFALAPDATISPASALPVQPASGGALTIDGLAGLGNCTAGKPRINLSGGNAPDGTSGLELDGADSEVCGLAVHGWPEAGVRLGGPGATVVDSYIGTDTTGVARDLGNDLYGIDVEAPGATIGSPGRGNILVGQYSEGQGEAAIWVGAAAGEGTVISANTIGLGADGAPIPNYDGISLNGDGTMVGGLEDGTGNVIAKNRGAGIVVDEEAQRNPLLRNAIYENTNSTINLKPGAFFFFKNDRLDLDEGGNRLQNMPGFGDSTTAANSAYTRIYTSLDSAPSQTFRLEFFWNSEKGCVIDWSDPFVGQQIFTGPPAQHFLGSIDVSTDPDGYASPPGDYPYEYYKLPPAPVGSYISATATDSEGNTSRISGCVEVGRLAEPTVDATVIPVDDNGAALVELRCNDLNFPCDADLTIDARGGSGRPEGERLAVTVPNDRRAHVRKVQLSRRTVRRVQRRGRLRGKLAVSPVGAARVRGRGIRLVSNGHGERGK
jgi:hypothetical protein